MKRNDWSYADLAEKLGTTKSQAHDWVNGTHEPNLNSIRHIAKAFDWDVAELIEAA
jgi:transcriptional regulator with XRE-family HTH domain